MDHSLKAFLASMNDARERASFASRCETSLQYLRHIAAGRKRPSVEVCMTLEKESAGAVSCEALRPDVDWAYLASRRVADRQGLKPHPATAAHGGAAANRRRAR